MKKILSFLLIIITGALLTGGFLIFRRFQQNPPQIVPYPYSFLNVSDAIELTAPILIAGDEMGDYFSKFKAELAEAISVNLSTPIKIQSIAKPGFGIHRTIADLKSLTQWPQILIYQGGSQEFKEDKFLVTENAKIKLNFSRLADDRLETAMILYPWLSRLIYEPMKRVILGTEPTFITDIPEDTYLNRLDTELLLYRQHLIEMVNLSKNKGSLIILTTTPINLDIAPKKVCSFSSNIEIEKYLLELKKIMEDDPKTAYNKSSKLVQQYTGNAEIFFLHGNIANRLGHIDEARESLIKAASYDCEPWRATEVQNAIIRSVAQDNQVLLFDFATLVERDWNQNATFFDESHPQNLYYQRGMQQLGIVIKDILKL